MTPREKDCLDAITGFIAQHGYSPSYQELMDALGTSSKSTIHRLVHGLADRGHVRLLYSRRRSVWPTEHAVQP